MKFVILPVLMSATNVLLLSLYLVLSAALSVCGAQHVVGRSGTAVVRAKALTKLQPVTNIPWFDLCALLDAGCH